MSKTTISTTSSAKKQKIAPATVVDRTHLKRSEDTFDIEKVLGEGTHGCVFRAKERATGATFALKRLDYDPKHEGLAVREIKILRKLRHPNVVFMAGIFRDNANKLLLQLEFCSNDFGALLKTPKMGGPSLFSTLGVAQVKGYMYQIVSALAFCHKQNVIHRDVKPENILITHDNVVKLADFGLAREQAKDFPKYTRGMQTLWYRAPEMCLGFSNYDTKVDMWSVGCLMGEFIYGSPMFPSQCVSKDTREQERGQLKKIYELCGTPDPYEWSAPEERQVVRASFDRPVKRPFLDALMKGRDKHKRCSYISQEALKMMDALFALNASKRISAAQVLEHAYFKEEFPRAYEPWQMATFRGGPQLSGVTRKRERNSKK